MTDLCRVFLSSEFTHLIIVMIFFPKYDPKEDRYQTKDITGQVH